MLFLFSASLVIILKFCTADLKNYKIDVSDTEAIKLRISRQNTIGRPSSGTCMCCMISWNIVKKKKKHHWPRTETGKHLARASGSAFLEFLLKVWRRSVEDKLERNINIDLSVRKVRPMYPSLLFHNEKLPISERIQDLAWSLPHRPAQSHLKTNKDWVLIHLFKIKASPMWMTDVAYIWLCTASLLSYLTLSYLLALPWIGLRAKLTQIHMTVDIQWLQRNNDGGDSVIQLA